MLPQWSHPLGELVAAPHVVDENVESTGFGSDPVHERADLYRLGVIGLNRNAFPAARGDQLGGLLDRLGPTRSRGFAAYAPAAAVDRGTGLAQRDGDAAAGAARRAGDEGDLLGEGTVAR